MLLCTTHLTLQRASSGSSFWSSGATCGNKQVLVQGVKHTDGITYTRCMEHMEITDESLGLAKPKAKPAKGPMRPEYDDVRMKPGLGLKQQPKQRQGLLTNMFKKKEPVVAAEPETIGLS